MIKVVSEDPSTPDAVVMLDELSDVLSVITGSSGKSSFDVNDVRVANARFVVARDQSGKAVGCGAFRPLESGIAEIKRMYSRRSMLGVGSAILSFLELEALKLGFAALRLETRVVNEKAVTFYERRGYSRIPNFGKYVGKEEAVCFEKRLAVNLIEV
jgi:ribosomal protein S18 acetylase RimI-like enzyme